MCITGMLEKSSGNEEQKDPYSYYQNYKIFLIKHWLLIRFRTYCRQQDIRVSKILAGEPVKKMFRILDIFNSQDPAHL